MNRIFVFAACLVLLALSAQAYQLTLEGMAAGKYPIIMEVDRDSNGALSGRYAYKSTLKRDGRDKKSSWLYITPNGYSGENYIVKDYHGNIQEVWSNAEFTKEDDVYRFLTGVTNAKGSSFAISARSTSKPSSSWAGSYSIHSEMYRSNPTMTVVLTLSPAGQNSYKGSWTMKCKGWDEEDSGTMTGSVIGTIVDGKLNIKLVSHTIKGGRDGNYFSYTSDYNPPIKNGTVIARISKSGKGYTIQPLNSMKYYLTDAVELSIVKTN